MKRGFFFLTTIGIVGVFVMGADFRKPETEATLVPMPVKKRCFGYTVIEAGKGLDCNGDTLILVKKFGYYEPASRYQKSIQ